MVGHVGQALGIVVVHGVLVPWVGVLGAELAVQHPLLPQPGAQMSAGVGILGHRLGDNVPGAGQRVLDGGHLVVDVRLGVFLRGAANRRLGEDHLGQGLQPALAGHGGAGAPLGAIGQVEVLDLLQRLGGGDARSQLVGELVLGVVAVAHCRLALGELAQVIGSFDDGA